MNSIISDLSIDLKKPLFLCGITFLTCFANAEAGLQSAVYSNSEAAVEICVETFGIQYLRTFEDNKKYGLVRFRFDLSPKHIYGTADRQYLVQTIYDMPETLISPSGKPFKLRARGWVNGQCL